MKRGGPLKRTGIQRRSPLLNRSPLLSRSPLKGRSAKRAKADPKRAALRKQMLDGNPLCQRCESAFATDLHELLRRSQGGDPLDAKGVAVLCRPCHTFVTENPVAGHAEGWVRWSWDAA